MSTQNTPISPTAVKKKKSHVSKRQRLLQKKLKDKKAGAKIKKKQKRKRRSNKKQTTSSLESTKPQKRSMQQANSTASSKKRRSNKEQITSPGGDSKPTDIDSSKPSPQSSKKKIQISRKRGDKSQLEEKPASRNTESNEQEYVEPYLEPDRNWKELAKKLGVNPSKRKGDKSRTEISEDKLPCRTSKDTIESSQKEIWFDDVDEVLLENHRVSANQKEDDKAKQETSELEAKLVKASANTGLTKCLAMDCEMVGVGEDGTDSVLARISVVNQYGHCVYDKFVKPREEVTDYRTWVSGVRAEDLETAEDFEIVQKEVDAMFKGRILVGHAIGNDEKVLFMNHPKMFIRDTQKYQGFRNVVGGKRKPGLKLLAKKILGVDIQSGEHSSVQDAQATMRLYTLVRQKWEAEIKEKYRIRKFNRQTLSKSKMIGNK